MAIDLMTYLALSKLTCATREEFQRSSKSIHEIDAWMLLQFNLSWLVSPWMLFHRQYIDQTSFDLCIARPRHGALYGANFPLSGMATQLSWRSSRFGFLGESAAIWAADSARCVLYRWGSACVWGHCKVNTSMTCTTSIFRYGRAFETEQTRLETQSFKMNSHHRVSLVHFLCRAVPLEFALIAALSDGSFCLSHGGNIWYFP